MRLEYAVVHSSSVHMLTHTQPEEQNGWYWRASIGCTTPTDTRVWKQSMHFKICMNAACIYYTCAIHLNAGAVAAGWIHDAIRDLNTNLIVQMLPQSGLKYYCQQSRVRNQNTEQQQL
jgi:hypothetical protein